MTTDRFDQKDLATNPYGQCKNCGIDIATQQAASDHMHESRHTIQILNQSRQSRIDSSVYFDIVDGLTDLFDRLHELVEDGDATVDEVSHAIAMGPSLDNEWDSYLKDVNE